MWSIVRAVFIIALPHVHSHNFILKTIFYQINTQGAARKAKSSLTSCSAASGHADS